MVLSLLFFPGLLRYTWQIKLHITLLGGDERNKTEVGLLVPDPKVGPTKRNCLEGVGNTEEQSSDESVVSNCPARKVLFS